MKLELILKIKGGCEFNCVIWVIHSRLRQAPISKEDFEDELELRAIDAVVQEVSSCEFVTWLGVLTILRLMKDGWTLLAFFQSLLDML